MISYTLKHLHQDIKQHLFCGRVLTNWNPRYFCALKEYIAADMAKLNNLCNHGNSRSFAVCFNDFMLTDARGRRKFDQQRFLQLCRTKFGSEKGKAAIVLYLPTSKKQSSSIVFPVLIRLTV